MPSRKLSNFFYTRHLKDARLVYSMSEIHSTKFVGVQNTRKCRISEHTQESPHQTRLICSLLLLYILAGDS